MPFSAALLPAGSCNETKASVSIYSNYNRDDHISLICSTCIKLFGELYNVHTMLTKSRSNWGAGVAFPAGICNLI